MKRLLIFVIALVLVTITGVTTLPPRTANAAPPAGKTLIWDGSNFNDTTKWNVGKSSAYPNNGPTNPGDNKLDYIAKTNAPSNGVFTADKRWDGKWNTDLVTTEYVNNGFELRPGDSVVSQITLNADRGTWPAIWTWGRDFSTGPQSGHGEIDLFEYHGDNPRMLELSNHVREGYLYADNVITPGVPFELRVDFGLSSVDFYVNNTLIWADAKGVPSSWRAWPIVNISVCAGQWHPAPSSRQTHMEFKVSKFHVYR